MKKLKRNTKITACLAIPDSLYSKLSTTLSFALTKVSTAKQKESFSNSFWAISCFLIYKCVHENDNLNYYVNVHHLKLKQLSSIDTSVIATIIKWLTVTNIFECNYNHCNTGPLTYSYGYRLSPALHHYFYSKSAANTQLIINVSFSISSAFLSATFNIDNDTLIKLRLKNKDFNSIYIIRDRKHKKDTDNEEVKLNGEYEDRDEMNEYEKTLSERMKRITVDLKKLNEYTGNDFKKWYWMGRILNCKTGDEVKFSHGRLYRNPYWHCLPKEFRYACVYDKKYNILEGFDVKNCFATLLLKVIEGKVSKQEYEKYKRTVRTGIYEDIAETTTKYDRNDMKQPFCHWLFSNNKTKKLPVNERFTIVRNYFKTEFPEIYELVTNYEEIEVDDKGKKVKKSKLSVDCQWIENELVLNTLCKWTEEKFGVECWTLHDAICCKEDDFIKINWSEVKGMWYEIMNLI